MMRLLALLLLLPTLARAAALCSCPCPALDDQSCYETPHHNTFRPPIPVHIVDQFATFDANAVNFHRVCAPTNKNDDCPTCPTQPDHYLGLELAQIVGTQPAAHVTVAYQFGIMSGDLGAPGFLEIPAGKSRTKPAPPPPAGLHSYNCYRLENPSGNVSGHAVTQDQFTAPGTYPVDLNTARGWTLCVGANVDDTDPGAVGISPVFLCNLVDDDPTLLPFNQLTVFADSALTGQITATITRYDNLCMPATLQ